MGTARLIGAAEPNQRAGPAVPERVGYPYYAGHPLPGRLLLTRGLLLAPAGRRRLGFADSPHAAGGYERSVV